MTKLQIIENMLKELPINQKIALVRKLEEDTLNNRMDSVLKRIDVRIKKHPLAEREITSEVKAARKKLYAKYYH